MHRERGTEKMGEELSRSFLREKIGIKSRKVLDALCAQAMVWEADRGEMIIHEGQLREEISWLIDGATKAYTIDQEGREIVHCLDYSPDFTAPLIMGADLRPGAREKCNIVAMKKSLILSLPYAFVLQQLKDEKEVRAYAFEQMRITMKVWIEIEALLRTYDAKKRISWFWERNPNLPDCFPNKDIASYLKLTPETYSRIIGQLYKSEG